MKLFMTSPTPLEVALEDYENALAGLDTPNISINETSVFKILSARDILQKQLEAAEEIFIDLCQKLIAQDARLKQNAYKITQVIDLEEYRETLSISEKAWWWYLENRESLHPCNRFDWLFRILKLLLLEVNFTLIVTIATRFLGGGSGWVEIGAVTFLTKLVEQVSLFYFKMLATHFWV
jgi:hypothetical protein